MEWRIMEDGDTTGHGDAWEKVTLHGHGKSWTRALP